MTRLTVGATLPEFASQTLAGTPLTDADLRGRRVLLSFRRYAACPVCNQHLATFRVRAAAELGPRGIAMFAVFHSPIERLRGYFAPEELPFEIIADPEFAVYEAFGVTTQPAALLHPGSLAAAIPAALSGLGDRRQSAVDGTRAMVPANFMIDDGRIVAAHYGEHLGDAWSIERVIEIADDLWGAPADAGGRVGVPHRVAPAR